MEPLAQSRRQQLASRCYISQSRIPMVSGTTQLVASLTTDMHGDNVPALYRHGYLAGTATHAPGNRIRTNI